jgi:hypothetical protein
MRRFLRRRSALVLIFGAIASRKVLIAITVQASDPLFGGDSWMQDGI